MVGTVVILAFGDTRDARIYNPWLDFVGMGGLEYISYKILLGKAGALAKNADLASENVKASFAAVRFIVNVGWSIYSFDHLLRYLLGSLDDSTVNSVYNLADFPTKAPIHLATFQVFVGQPG